MVATSWVEHIPPWIKIWFISATSLFPLRFIRKRVFSRCFPAEPFTIRHRIVPGYTDDGQLPRALGDFLTVPTHFRCNRAMSVTDKFFILSVGNRIFSNAILWQINFMLGC